MHVGKPLVNGLLEDSESTEVGNKRNFVWQVTLGWVFLLPLCLIMVNAELFVCNSPGVREPVISIDCLFHMLVCYLEA